LGFGGGRSGGVGHSVDIRAIIEIAEAAVTINRLPRMPNAASLHWFPPRASAVKFIASLFTGADASTAQRIFWNIPRASDFVD
jgi:hypothetical protein